MKVPHGIKKQPMPSHLLITSFKNTNGDEREKSPGNESGSINFYLYRLRTEHPMKLSPGREVKGVKDPYKATVFLVLKVNQQLVHRDQMAECRS